MASRNTCRAESDTVALNWRSEQADHHDRMARLSNAYAAAYEGDVGFAVSAGQRTYLRARARAFRKDAAIRREMAKKLRNLPSSAALLH